MAALRKRYDVSMLRLLQETISRINVLVVFTFSSFALRQRMSMMTRFAAKGGSKTSENPAKKTKTKATPLISPER